WVWKASPQQRQHIRQLADKLKSIARNRAESHTAAAFIKWQDGNFAGALDEDLAATKARAACPRGRAVAHTVYGFHLIQTGHPDEAQVQYRKGIQVSPTSPTGLHHLGHPYFVRRQFDKALELYQASTKAGSSHWLGYYWM